MSAPQGNRFWEARTKHGRDKKFTPDALWAGCLEYFAWVHENPLWEDKVFMASGEPVHVPIAKMRAMTLGGLSIFLDINRSTWKEYAADKDFSATVARAEEVIRDQKFTGAASDLLNSNIIARDLGLTDKIAHGVDPDAPLIPILNVTVGKVE